jgi:hypothetical protein
VADDGSNRRSQLDNYADGTNGYQRGKQSKILICNSFEVYIGISYDLGLFLLAGVSQPYLDNSWTPANLNPYYQSQQLQTPEQDFYNLQSSSRSSNVADIDGQVQAVSHQFGTPADPFTVLQAPNLRFT